MGSNSINQIKPFRIVADELMYTHIGTSLIHFKKPAKYVMEYKNPRAKEFYQKAQDTKDISEKIKLYEQMGDYELKALNFKEYIKDVFKIFLEKFLLK